jgi:hypothetical protein
MHFVQPGVCQQVLEFRGLGATEGHDDNFVIRGDETLGIVFAQKLKILQTKFRDHLLDAALFLVGDIGGLR